MRVGVGGEGRVKRVRAGMRGGMRGRMRDGMRGRDEGQGWGEGRGEGGGGWRKPPAVPHAGSGGAPPRPVRCAAGACLEEMRSWE